MHIRIADKLVGKRNQCFIIAEAGVNHNGNFRLAKKMIDVAKETGVDAIKFQAFKTEELVTKLAPKALYQRKYNKEEKTQFKMLKRLELSEDELAELFKYCGKKKIIFLATPFDFKSAEFLYKVGVPAFKIASGDVTNTPFLAEVARYQRPVILSTGMSTMAEIKEAISAIYSTGNKRLILLHCTSVYPAKYNDVNLRAMDVLGKRFKVPIGYSDHTSGIEISLAAVALGARLIEKHFTLSKSMKGPDHAASIEPEELEKLVKGVRAVEKSLGVSEKKPVKAEVRMMNNIRKSIVALDTIAKGSIINENMLVFKRPGSGLAPKLFSKIIGKKAKKNIKKDELISFSKLY